MNLELLSWRLPIPVGAPTPLWNVTCLGTQLVDFQVVVEARLTRCNHRGKVE